ncbi:MAG: hypothetical protein HY682_03450 [Chloroflexi bacterium]|nr:hypothetical protein [Chloroflexota bacterium]
MRASGAGQVGNLHEGRSTGPGQALQRAQGVLGIPSFEDYESTTLATFALERSLASGQPEKISPA